MEPREKRRPGRPEGRAYPHSKTLKLRDADVQRLDRLAGKLDRDASWVIREAVRRMAVAEGVE